MRRNYFHVPLLMTATILLASAIGQPLPASAETSLDRFVGQWWLDFADGYGGWLQVQNTEPRVRLLWRVGSARTMNDFSVENDQLIIQRNRRNQKLTYIATIEEDEITVSLQDSQETATGKKCPPMPPRPDLAKIRFGQEIALFNGRDLKGWTLQPSHAKNGWRAEDGELINETPKTDFSGYGAYGNLRTDAVFGDCQLHIEFNIGQQRNSGVYVRGLYEAQVVDRDSPMQGISGPGAVFGRVAPSINAGLPGGQWQTYDITLVDRHITVVLNGTKVIDNQPVLGCTGGALFGDVTRDGPLYLQGDHTSVRYRNIRLRPRLK